MKTLAFTALTLALAAASPAFAASHHRVSAHGAYARATAVPGDGYAEPSTVVIDNGQIVGADPDPFIRAMIERDHGLPAS